MFDLTIFIWMLMSGSLIAAQKTEDVLMFPLSKTVCSDPDRPTYSINSGECEGAGGRTPSYFGSGLLAASVFVTCLVVTWKFGITLGIAACAICSLASSLLPHMLDPTLTQGTPSRSQAAD